MLPPPTSEEEIFFTAQFLSVYLLNSLYHVEEMLNLLAFVTVLIAAIVNSNVS